MRLIRICFLGALLAAVGQSQSRGESIIPADLCETLPKPNPNIIEAYRRVFPAIPPDNTREVPPENAVELLQKAADKKWSTIDFFTEDAFRAGTGQCMFYFPKKSLHEINKKFKLRLVTTIKGTDVNNKEFHMTAYFGGLGMHYIFYDRDEAIEYKPESQDNVVRLHPVIQQKIPEAGGLDVAGISVQYKSLWLDVLASRKKSSTELNIYIKNPLPRLKPLVRTTTLHPIEPTGDSNESQEKSSLWAGRQVNPLTGKRMPAEFRGLSLLLNRKSYPPVRP